MTAPASGAPPAGAPAPSGGFQSTVSNVHLPSLPESQKRKRRKSDGTMTGDPR